MNRGIIIATLMAAALPLRAGIVLTLSPNVSPTNAGTYAAGTFVVIGASGTVSLDGPIGNPNPLGLVVTNPDGSLSAGPDPSAGYAYFLPGHAYPTAAGGDGINHFVGGGGNYDLFPDGHPAFALEGNPTTDTLASGVLRFGALAGTFSASPTATDWFLVGFGGTFPTGAGGTLLLVVVDRFYPNDFGTPGSPNGYTVTVDTIPEPSVAWLALSGIAVLGLRRYRARVR
jgi:hypothetical protein